MNSAVRRQLGYSYTSWGVPGLQDLAVMHHPNPGGHGHGLFLIVGDHHAGHPDAFDDVGHFQLHLLPQFFIQGRHRFVQQQQFRPLGEAARQGDALALTTGELVRVNG